MTTAIYANPITGAAWTGPLPTHAAWDPLSQTFAFVPSQGAQPADDAARALCAEVLTQALYGPPKARQPHKGGFVTLPPRILACPTCASTNIQVPVVAKEGTDKRVIAWFGRGECTCPDCGYTGTSVKSRGYSMYDYTDLVQARLDQGPAQIARMQASTP